MKRLIFYTFSFVLLGLINIYCKKADVSIKPIASLNVVNAVIGGGNVKLNTVERDSSKIYNARLFGLNAGVTSIRLYPTTNPVTAYYDAIQNIESGGIYSIFLAGQSPTYDYVFNKDNIPPYYSDSSIGIRVVNLSSNSTPLNITLASATTTNLFSAITYKQLTEFIKLTLATLVPVNNVTFQVRNAAGTLLTTYTLPPTANSTYANISILNSRFRNLTLVVKGVYGVTSGGDAFGIYPVANY